MNYEKNYQKLIESRKNRTLKDNKHYEKHHIVPKCLGGKNIDENLVYLTYREHYIAHWLLYKMAKNKNERIKLGWAFFNMTGSTETNKRCVTSKQFQRARLLLSEVNKGKKLTKEHKKKLSESKIGEKNPMFGKVHPPDVMKKISKGTQEYWTEEKRRENGEKSQEQWKTSEYRRKYGNGQKGKKRTEETKRKISESSKGREKSDEHRKKIAETIKNIPKKRCPYCKKWFGPGNYKRWHGDKCKLNVNI